MKITKIKSTDKIIIAISEEGFKNIETLKFIADRLRDRFDNEFAFIPIDSEVIIIEE